MAGSKEIKNRIKSVQSTHQITKAMEIVSTTKFRRFSALLQQSKPYSESINKILNNLSSGIKTEKHSLFDGKKEVKKIAVIVMTSDRGLCGSFNNATLKAMEKLLKENEGKEAYVITIGRTSLDYCRKRKYEIKRNYSQIAPEIMYEISQEIGELIVKEYNADNFDEVYIVYNRFISALKTELETKRIIPMERIETDKKMTYIFEPDPNYILSTLLPKYITVQIYQALVNNTASEHSSRKNSMKSATENAEEMIKKLNLQYNRERQAAITQEISEIVGGASAL